MNKKATMVACVRSFPVLSNSAVRLSQMLGDERTGPDEFEKVIRPDVALTANLLQAANSAHFGLPREVTSVRQAVSLLGKKRLFDITMGSAFHQVVPETVPGYEMDTRSFWEHAVAVAVLSELLAGEIRGMVPEMTFTLGLLHDLGKLAIASVLLKDLERINGRLEAGDDLVTAELNVLGFDHAMAGALLTRVWKLPESFGEPIGFHHKPSEAPKGETRKMAELLHLGDVLAHSLGFGADVGEMSRTVDEGVIGRLGISDRQLEHVASRAIGDIQEMSEALTPSR